MRPRYHKVGSLPKVQSAIEGYLVVDEKFCLDDDDDDDDSEDVPWLDFSEINAMGSGKLYPSSLKARQKLGLLHDCRLTGKTWRTEGCFHVSDPWWVIKIVRTTTRSSLFRSKDFFALSYHLRQDSAIIDHKLITMWIKACQKDEKNKHSNEETQYFDDSVMNKFFSAVGKDVEKLTFDQLDELDRLVKVFSDGLPKDDRAGTRLEDGLHISEAARYVRRAKRYPILFHYFPQLFPLQFCSLILQDDEILEACVEALDEQPWIFGFRKLLYNKIGMMGCETSLKALDLCGLLNKIPIVERDALVMYEFLKCDAKSNGHTCSRYDYMLKMLNETRELRGNPVEALIYLCDKYIVKIEETDNGAKQVYLYSLWKCEKSIADGLTSLIKTDAEQPWTFDVNLESPEFDKIRSDPHQVKAARIMTGSPVVTISGKGGCGKTEVVTQVLKCARSKKPETGRTDESPIPESTNHFNLSGTDLQCNSTGQNNSQIDESSEILDEHNHDTPELIMPLYTAPTGKAANLLGQRAGMSAYTLHQIIFSYRRYAAENQESWQHEKINVLIVDECSLVSVQTFSTLLMILMQATELRRVVLLGDWRQLPSVEPGNFLEDVFGALKKFNLAVELKINHRTESELIVQNATRISERRMPYFNDGSKFVLYGSEQDEMDGIEITNVLRHQMLQHEDFSNDRTSHLIAFQRKSCEQINEICCQKYNNHSLKNDRNKLDFRVGDKICLTKNGSIRLYELNENSVVEPVYEEKVKPDEQPVANADKKRSHKPKQIAETRLCNGEIFFIIHDTLKMSNTGGGVRYLTLSDGDENNEVVITVECSELKKKCKMRHAWARTIHTFQGSEIDTIGYVLYPCLPQNWRHVYTAITRGKKAVHITGSKPELQRTIGRRHETRKTSLNKQLHETLTKLDGIIDLAQTQSSQSFTGFQKQTHSMFMSTQTSQPEAFNSISHSSTQDNNEFTSMPVGGLQGTQKPTTPKKRSICDMPSKFVSRSSPNSWYRHTYSQRQSSMDGRTVDPLSSQQSASQSKNLAIHSPVMRNLFSSDKASGRSVSGSPFVQNPMKPTHTSTPLSTGANINRQNLSMKMLKQSTTSDNSFSSLLNILEELQDKKDDQDSNEESLYLNSISENKKLNNLSMGIAQNKNVVEGCLKADSQCSQWSDIDDEAYGNLNLDDPNSHGYSKLYRNMHTKSPILLSDYSDTKSTENISASDDTSPIIHTSVTSPNKRQLSTENPVSPKRLHIDFQGTEKPSIVSPMRQKITKLKIEN